MRRAHPTRVGVFAIGAVALIVAAIVAVSGGRLFSDRERAVMYFDGSIYGLQLGAPVVFRGVRLGSVRSIGVITGGPGSFSIPVEIELDRNLIRDPKGQPDGPAVKTLVDQGLTARLSTQSLLTGLLYVDLDLRPAGSKTPSPTVRKTTADGLTEIPTEATPIQNFQKQLQGLDLAKLVDDISSLTTTARQLISDPKVRGALEDLAAASGDLRRVLARLEKRIDPLANAVQGTLDDSRRTLAAWGQAGDKVAGAVDRAAAALGRADALLAEGVPMLQSVQRAADELGRSAASLRATTGEDSPLLQQVQRAAQDVSRASRAVRDLADLLERQPESLIRGRTGP